MANINYKETQGNDNWVSQAEFDSLDLSTQEKGTVYELVGEVSEADLDVDLQTKINGKLDAPAIAGTSGQVLTAEDTSNNLIWKTLKTLFGNQSLFGTGNIDLYNHDISIGGLFDNDVISIEFNRVSSKNIVVDSINDLITLLGNKFRISVSGFLDTSGTGSLQNIHMLSTTDGGGYLRFHIGVEDYAVADIQTLIITDTVTTV